MANTNYIYGYHAVYAALNNAPHCIKQLYLQATRCDERMNSILEKAALHSISVNEMPRRALDGLVANQPHQGLIAECTPVEIKNETFLENLVSEHTGALLLLLLDGVQDPHNLGACLRTANAMGVHAVIAPKDKSASLTPTAQKVACGAALITPFVQVTNLSRTMEQLKAHGIWFIGADANAEKPLKSIDGSGNIGIVMGSEGHGLRRLTRERCDFLVSIPMSGTVSSINVSTAAAICLYEVVRCQK